VKRFLPWLSAVFIRLLYATLRVRHIDVDKIEKLSQYIFTFWHEHLIVMLHARYRRPIQVLVSQSRDGEYIASTFAHYDVDVSRGSTTRGFGPRRRPRISCRASCSRCRRQLVRSDEYKPSRRNSAPTSPGFLHASACLRRRSRYSAVNVRRSTFAGTSGSGGVVRDGPAGPATPVALRAPSAASPAGPSISTPVASMRSIHQTLPAPH